MHWTAQQPLLGIDVLEMLQDFLTRDRLTVAVGSLSRREQFVPVECGVLGGIVEDVTDVLRSRVETAPLPGIIDPIKELLGNTDIDLNEGIVAIDSIESAEGTQNPPYIAGRWTITVEITVNY